MTPGTQVGVRVISNVGGVFPFPIPHQFILGLRADQITPILNL